VTPLPLAAALVALAVTAPVPRALEPGVAARVNGVAITSERLDRYFEDFLADAGRNVAAIRSPKAYEGLRRQALERLVDTELLWQEAQRRRIGATRPEAEAALAEVRAGFKRPGAFEARLSRGGFTEASYIEWLRVQLSIRRLVQEEIVARVTVTAAEEDAAREEVRASRPDLPEAEARRAAHEQALAQKAQETLAARIRGLREVAVLELPGTR
jgi:hypothetical protein